MPGTNGAVEFRFGGEQRGQASLISSWVNRPGSCLGMRRLGGSASRILQSNDATAGRACTSLGSQAELGNQVVEFSEKCRFKVNGAPSNSSCLTFSNRRFPTLAGSSLKSSRQILVTTRWPVTKMAGKK